VSSPIAESPAEDPAEASASDSGKTAAVASADGAPSQKWAESASGDASAAGRSGSDSPPAPPSLYPFPRHARAVLAAAKEDIRVLLQHLEEVVGDALRVCEEALKREAEREARRAEQALAVANGSSKRSVVRAAARRAAPALRHIERDFALLSRACTQLLNHRVVQLVYSVLFPLYSCVCARKTAALQAQLHAHRHLTFRQMGLAEELIAVTRGSGSSNGETDISYQHAIDAFGALARLQSPVDKLQCVVGVAKAICACVDQAKQAQARAAEAGPASSSSSSSSSPVVISADDLLLLFTYLLVHARRSVPSLAAELSFLADFIPAHDRCRMSGYYLAVTTSAAELIRTGTLLKEAQSQQEQQQAESDAATAAGENAVRQNPQQEQQPPQNETVARLQ